MTAGLVYDHDALPETCHAEGHVPGCSGMAGGDHEYLTSALSYLRCSECGGLLDAYGSCSVHGLLDYQPTDDDREGPYNTAGGHEHWDEGGI